MDYLNSLLLWVHLVALALGGAATFGIPVAGRMIATATPEQRPLLFAVNKGLSTVGRTGLVLLLITGPLLVWLKYGGVAGFTVWFWVKMGLVLLLLVNIIASGINSARAAAGDMAAAKRGAPLGLSSLVLFLGVVLSAVLTFE